MKVEIPVFRRCCFCLPLRYGLLAWGYFKMTADVFLAGLMTYLFVDDLMMISLYGNALIGWNYTELIVSLIGMVVFFADFIVTIVFIVGGLKKNVRPIRVFYYHCMGMLVATFLLLSLTVVRLIYRLTTSNIRYWGLGSRLVSVCFFFVVLVVQVYFLLLLRSEIIKLRNTGEFRFVNNAAEAECTMKCDEIAVEAETDKEGV